MFASITNPFKITIGAFFGVLIGGLVMVVHYEGISLPIIGQIVNGRVANAVEAATERLVHEAERKAQQAETAERLRQTQAAAIALEDYRRKLEAERTAQAQVQDKLEQEIADHEREIKALGRSCAVIDDADRDWLLRH